MEGFTTNPTGRARPSRGGLFLWPIALFTVLHQTRDTLGPGTASDFIPVWRAAQAFVAGARPYEVTGFVYPPSALLIFAPFGGLSFDHAHLLFHVINSTCIVIAAVLAFQAFTLPLGSTAAPAIMFALFISAPVRLSLYAENVNGIVVAAAMIAFSYAINGRWAASGWPLGFSLAVKPVLLPLVLLLAAARRWRALTTALAVPVLLSALALPILSGGLSYLTEVVPFLWQGNYPQNYMINTSIVGAAEILAVPPPVATAARVLAGLGGLGLIWLRLRSTGDKTVLAAHVIGLVLTTTFLVFSFSWPYYALYLLPTFVSVASPRSTLCRWRYVLFGSAAYLIASPDYLARLGAVRVTCGYVVLLAALSWRWSTPSQENDTGSVDARSI